MSTFMKLLNASATRKHIVESVTDYSKMFLASLQRKKLVRTNTVQQPTNSWQDKTHTFVSGRTHDVILGPDAKTSKTSFVVALDRGYQVKKYNKHKGHHFEGDYNTLVPYKKKETALSSFINKLW